MLTYALALLAAAANAVSWVLQRKANREIPQNERLTWKLIRDLLRKPVWFAGILAITVGFVLQAAALGTGALAVVEPILVLELPMTLVLASRLFRQRLGAREWTPVAAMTVGLAVLLFLLSPSTGSAGGTSWYIWVLAIAANVGLIAVLVAWTRAGRLPLVRSAAKARWGHLAGPQQAAILGVAAGAAFGLTAALMKGMTDTFAGGFVNLLTSWQLYAMIASGAVGMFLTQSALNAGRLVAAQPGISLMDPVISVLWGVLVFNEQVRSGLLVIPEVVSLALIAFAAVELARSPLLAGR